MMHIETVEKWLKCVIARSEATKQSQIYSRKVRLPRPFGARNDEFLQFHIQKLQRIAPIISDAFFFLFKVYLLFFFGLIVLETVEPGLVSGHISFSAWAMATLGMGLIAFLAEYVQPSQARLPFFRRSNIFYTILLASCILIWIMLSLR